MQPLTTYYAMVEQTIRDFKVDPALCRGQQPGQWNMMIGSANLWIDVFQSKDTAGNLIDAGYLQIMSPVCQVPADNQAAFTKELLEINHKLYGTAFTIFENGAYIKTIRELEGLDAAEMMNTFKRVGYYADDYDDMLKAKYFPATGGRG